MKTLCLALLLSLLSPLPSQAAPTADLWALWEAHIPDSPETVDHRPWQRFLMSHMRPGGDGVTRMGYGCVRQGDRAALKGYISGLTRVAVSRLSRPEQFAYWVNLYNALTVDVVLDHYPVAGIRDIQVGRGVAGWFTDAIFAGPWIEKLVTVEGQQVSLDDIEHRILRPIWKDPRIHYALNCAAMGCPNLQGAFTAANTETLLERGARSFINSPRGVRVEGTTAVASEIYFWFGADFALTEQPPLAVQNPAPDLLTHFKKYADPGLAKALEGVTTVKPGVYDWALNDERCSAY